MSIVPTLHLTAGHPKKLAEQIRSSFSGQAHFAASGPAKTTCGDCVFHNDYFASEERRRRRPGCLKFYQLMKRHGDAVPATAKSCRYYEPKK